MEQINIASAQYMTKEDGVIYAVKATIDGKNYGIPVSMANRHYAEIMRQVEAGTLTILAAD